MPQRPRTQPPADAPPVLSSRATKRLTAAAVIRTWQTKDRRYAVEEIKSLFGLPTRYLVVERLANGNEAIISEHRKREPAVEALARHINRQRS